MNALVETRKIFALYFLTLLATVGLVQGCASANAIAKAETVEQKAYAAYGTFVIAQEQAAKLVSSGQLSNSAIIRIGETEERAKNVADSLVATTLEFQQVKEEFQRAETTEERFVNAANSLNEWAERLVPLVNNLYAALKGEAE